MVNVIVVGAGQGGCKIIEALAHHPEIKILCVVDTKSDAPGMIGARALTIQTHQNYEEVVHQYRTNIDVILEATGVSSVYEDLRNIASPDTQVISGVSLRFFMLLVQDKDRLIAELHERGRELQLVLNSTYDGMIGINRDGVVTLFNRAAATITGIAPEQVLLEKVDEAIPSTALTRILQTGVPELNQLQVIGDVEVVTNRMPVFDESGELIGAIAVFRDVTELRQLGAQVSSLREVQTLLEAIIQSTQDAISVVDKDGLGLVINPAYTRLTGLTPSDVIGKPADVDIAEGDSMHMRVLKTKQPVKNVQMKVGPSSREVIVDVAPILVNGELRGSVGVIHDVSEIRRLTDELEKANRLIRSIQAKYTFDDIIGHSQAMVLALEQAKQAAQTPATVLLRGESGTGKELFAHAIHNASTRRYHSFLRVNCAALSESLLESELFGYDEGAFTGAKRGGKKGLFEEASGGTLFLDEIGEMNIATQVKLLRAIQEQEIVRVGGTKAIPIDVRIIAATHVNLEQAVASGKFREDLYYRLNVIPIVIPPLRYRKQDLEDITLHIILKQNQVYGRNISNISSGALAVLEEYDWPGNVRELENTIGRAMIHVTYADTTLRESHLPILVRRQERLANDGVQSSLTIPLGTKLQDIVRLAEKSAIETALRDTKGNKTEAAKRLGISVRSLYYKMEQNDIREERS